MAWRFDDLQVAGYCDVLLSEQTPKTVLPFFRGPAGQYLFPPFKMDAETILSADLRHENEVDNLEARKMLTIIPPVPARRDYLLWVDGDLSVHYEDKHRVLERLRNFSKDQCARGFQALREHDYQAALAFSQKAITANDRALDGWLIQIICHRVLGDSEHADFLVETAMKVVPECNLDALASFCIGCATGS